MTDNFPLIKQLGDLEKNPAGDKPLLPKGIKYDEKVVIVENQEIQVFIPLRESTDFDTAISEHGKYISRHEFSMLLRKHRGIRN